MHGGNKPPFTRPLKAGSPHSLPTAMDGSTDQTATFAALQGSALPELEVLMAGNILGGGSSGNSGGVSPITLALMALLAYRTYHGKGRLADMLGRNSPDAEGESAPEQADAAGSGGFGNILGEILGRGSAGRSSEAGVGGGLGDLLRGGLGGILGGGAAGGLLGPGLNELLKKFQQNGPVGAADSWVKTGPNQSLTSAQIEHALGRETLQSLSDETGKSYDEVLSELTQEIPGTVDRLTPDGRVPPETSSPN